MMKGLLFLLSFAMFATAQVQEQMDVNLVELDVRTQDLNGAHITGLTASDFIVKENGKQHKIDSLVEINVATIDAEKREYVRPRTMILLDVKNTQYPVMAKIFPKLRDYVKNLYDSNAEIGLALNSDGIIEIASFTRDQKVLTDAIDKAESFFKERRYRIYGSTDAHNLRNFNVTDNKEYTNTKRDADLSRRKFVKDHNRNDMDVLGQFVRYIGAFEGTKNIVLISQGWEGGNARNWEGEIDHNGVTSLRDIQSTCLYQKVSINFLQLVRGDQMYNNKKFYSERLDKNMKDNFYSGGGANLASATAGSYIKTPYQQADKWVNHIVNDSHRFYRIRYYATSPKVNFRHVEVSIPGANRIANALNGYYPDRKIINIAHTGIKHLREKESMSLNIPTDWMIWKNAGFKKQAAYYAVSQKAWDADGHLIYEDVFSSEANRKKSRGTYSSVKLAHDLKLTLPKGKKPARVETKVIDLSSGKSVIIPESVSFGQKI